MAKSVFFFAQMLFIFAASSGAQTISGIVRDSQNAPVERAEISLTDQTKIIARTLTDAEGRFSLDLQNTHNSLLIVKAKGFADFSRVLPRNFSENLNIVLSPQAVRDEVTVSITRAEARLAETPASVVVLTRETLDTTAAQATDDQLRQIAGFNLFRRSSSKTTNPTAQGANFRGLAGSGASRAAILFDGLSLNDAFGGWTFWSRVPRAAIEQAEVLRGGASSFYGNQGLSGAINFLTAAPKENEFVLRFEASAGTQGTADASVFGAFRKNDWTIDAAAESFRTNGYIPVPEIDAGAADAEANSRHNNIFLTVARTFGENARVFARGSYFTENRENGTRVQYNQTRFRQLAGGADFANDAAGAFQLRAYLETQVYDQTFSALSADRETETLSRIQRVPSQAFGANALWSRAVGAHAIAASFEFRQVRGFSNEIGFFGGRATSLNDSGGRERTVSVFAQDLWRVSGKLVLNFGARFDAWKNFGALSSVKTLADGQKAIVNFPDRDETALSPRVGALYQISENFALVASYAKSFRAPSLNELYRGFRVGNVNTLPNENLRAERADTFETGVNFTGFSRKLAARGNFFLTEIKNPVVSVTLATTPNLITRRRENVGQTRARGFELDAEFAPVSKLKFSASYLFTDSRVARFPANFELENKFLPQVARHQMTFQSVYRPTAKLAFSMQARFSGAQFEDDLNTLRLRPYATFDAFASYKFKKIEVFTAVENIFDNRYDIGLTPNRTIAAPRFARVGLRFYFGEK